MDRGAVHAMEMIEGEVVSVPYRTIEEGFRLTLEEMAAGEPLIPGALLISRPFGMRGKPDQIRKIRGKSAFGDYAYCVVEVELAGNLKQHQFIKAAFNNLLLGHIQDATPEEFFLVNGYGDEKSEVFAEWNNALDTSVASTRDIIAGKIKPRPIYGDTPAPWQSYGDRSAEESRDVTLLPGVKSALRNNLNAAGYYTIDDMARANEKDLSAIPKIGRETANRHIFKAKAIVEGVPIRRSVVQFPDVPVEMFLDMENLNQGSDLAFGTQMGFFNYLIGVVVKSELEECYVPFFAETPAKEERCRRDFCALIDRVDSVAIYCWSSAEKTYIDRMKGKYATREETVNKLTSSLHDLSRLARDSFAFPTTSDGLKDIAKSLGFDWRLIDFDGNTAWMRYHQYFNSGLLDTEARDEILTYNEDDCRAVMHVKDWLVENSP